MDWNYNDLCNWTDENIIPNVTTLNISNNININDFASRILQLIYLYVNSLKIFKFNLNIFPLKIFKLINLQKFDCSNNQITNLPNEIEQLINLQKFYCSNNQITNLPNEIGQLINLRIFDCSNNQITNLPN